MSVVIREGNLDQDEGPLIVALGRFLTPLSTAARFAWLYRNNPYGPAKVWLALERDTQAVIGVAAAFPRRIYYGACAELAWVLGDFCVSERYRTMGPALQLQRACLSALETENVALWYDFPSQAMMAVYKRLGFAAPQRMVRLAMPLRVDRQLGRVIKFPIAARSLSLIGNGVLALRNRACKVQGSLTIAEQKARCGDEFSSLARSIGSRQGACIVRSAEYINWRYLDNPLYRYQLFTARREGALLGYAVFAQNGQDAVLADLFGRYDGGVFSGLVSHGVSQMTARGVETLSVPLFEFHPLRGFFERHGFKLREATPLMIQTVDHKNGGDGRWYFMHGDRDS